jgi:uncharacterized Zn-finger protein
MTLPIFDEIDYLTLETEYGKSIPEVSRHMNENLVECVCGRRYRYAILEGELGIFLEPKKARVACPFCGSTDWVSIKAHSGDFFNATWTRA